MGLELIYLSYWDKLLIYRIDSDPSETCNALCSNQGKFQHEQFRYNGKYKSQLEQCNNGGFQIVTVIIQ